MQVEAMCRAGTPFDPPNIAETTQRIDDVSIGLFGVTLEDTICHDYDEFPADDGEEPFTPEEYEKRFSATWAPWDQAKPFWEAIGWDLTDGKGKPLKCHWCFERQIIACSFELVEGARFTPDGSGRWQGAIAEELDERRLQAWTEELRRQVQSFLEKKRRAGRF